MQIDRETVIALVAQCLDEPAFAHDLSQGRSLNLNARELQAIVQRAAEAERERWQPQHNRDSQELRNLCQARDDARRERDLAKVEIAALESSRATLGRLVDELRVKAERYDYLRGRDLSAIKAGGVFAGKTPDNVVLNGEDLDAAIDAARGAQGEHL